MRVEVHWTETNLHSGTAEVDDDADLTDPAVRAKALEQAMEPSGTYQDTTDRVIDYVGPLDTPRILGGDTPAHPRGTPT